MKEIELSDGRKVEVKHLGADDEIHLIDFIIEAAPVFDGIDPKNLKVDGVAAVVVVAKVLKENWTLLSKSACNLIAVSTSLSEEEARALNIGDRLSVLTGVWQECGLGKLIKQVTQLARAA